MQGSGSQACLDLLTFVLFGSTSYSLEDGNSGSCRGIPQSIQINVYLDSYLSVF